jgi:hypothetical protein
MLIRPNGNIVADWRALLRSPELARQLKGLAAIMDTAKQYRIRENGENCLYSHFELLARFPSLDAWAKYALLGQSYQIGATYITRVK